MPDETCSIEVSADRMVNLRCEAGWFSSELKHSLLTMRSIERLDRIVSRQPDLCEQEDLQLLGGLLYSVLFDGQATQIHKLADSRLSRIPIDRTLGDLFLEQLKHFEARCSTEQGERLRINLSFDEKASDIARYPWEFLFVDKGDDKFFVAGQRTHLILTRTLSPTVAQLAPNESLVVWVAWAQPAPNDPLPGIETMSTEIQARLGGGENVTLREFKRITLKDFQKAMEDVLDDAASAPDVIHLICHGQFDNDAKKSQLAFHLDAAELTDARNAAAIRGSDPGKVSQAKWVNAEFIQAQLQRRPPRLFFLHSCNSGRAGPAIPAVPGVEAFRGAAQLIANAGVPFVVAMQYEIENGDARNFMREFYDEIGKGRTIDAAVTSGRDVLGRQEPPWGHRRFATPVVYMRSASQALLRPRVRPAVVEYQNTSLRKCPNCYNRMVDIDESSCRCTPPQEFQVCANRHASKMSDTVCRIRGCGLPLRAAPAAPRPADAPAPSSSDLGVA